MSKRLSMPAVSARRRAASLLVAACGADGQLRLDTVIQP
jgi:hypothetical protein